MRDLPFNYDQTPLNFKLEPLPSFEARMDERDARENHLREEAAARVNSMEEGQEKEAAKDSERDRIAAFDVDKARVIQARAQARAGDLLAGSPLPSLGSGQLTSAVI